MAEIELKSVTKSFGNTIALYPFDLLIENGSFTVVVGPSG